MMAATERIEMPGWGVYYKPNYEFWLFRYANDLVNGTRNFSDCIGEGYHGPIYRGTLSGDDGDGLKGEEVAVKLLNEEVAALSSNDLECLAHDIGRAGHPNIAKFLGFCNGAAPNYSSGILVYEFVPATLASYLHDRTATMRPLDWDTRMEVLHGVAKALDYLHNTLSTRIMYRNLKTSNILLDGCFRPKLSGLGPGQFTRYRTTLHDADNVEVSAVDCDIRCFGMVMLETLTGRRDCDVTTHGSSTCLLDWVLSKLLSGEWKEIQDPSLKGKVEHSAFGKALRLAMRCTDVKRSELLPNIKEVISEMEYVMGQKKVRLRPFEVTIEIQGDEMRKKNKDTSLIMFM